MSVMSAAESQVNKETEREFSGNISSLNRCITKDARRLCIFDLFHKFRSVFFDIGGCYTDDKPDLWFYFTTTVCPGKACLVNLFVCHRRTGSFSVGISNSNETLYGKDDYIKTTTLSDNLSWYRFQSSQIDQNHYVKTFSFNSQEMKRLEDTVLYIPISIDMQPLLIINSELIESIKLQHNARKISSINTKEDFTLISVNGKVYPVHKIAVGAHSTVLRELIKKSNSSLQLNENDNEVQIIIKVMYMDIINNMSEYDLVKVLEIVYKYEFTYLYNLINQMIESKINISNAVDLAVLAKKYNLEALKIRVFNFIQKSPDVINTDAWKKLDDVELRLHVTSIRVRHHRPATSSKSLYNSL